MTSLSFLTPLAGLVALVAVVPLVSFARRERRARAVRRALALSDPPSGQTRLLLAALVAVPVLTGVAAAQPVIDRSPTVPERVDAEVLFAIDTSRSMAASAGPVAPTRFDRARDLALDVRSQLRDVPAGVASFTDRALPHLFPTVDASSFSATLARSVGVERPPPGQSSITVATDLGALATVASGSLFSPASTKRLLVVLTDGETQDVDPGLGAALDRARIRAIFVHVWGSDEKVFATSRPEAEYRSDPTSGSTLRQVATLVGGSSFSAEDVEGIVARARDELGEGPVRPRPARDLLTLMPYLTIAALVPLAFVVRRRNV